MGALATVSNVHYAKVTEKVLFQIHSCSRVIWVGPTRDLFNCMHKWQKWRVSGEIVGCSLVLEASCGVHVTDLRMSAFLAPGG
ncbi:hypothetical protein GW17_00033130 [Ensete ventricosum]|uniref:Uncharacterized protein n=1 Tax=Ensete ventricosum TaxID=4639 RepID=A0A426XAP7_ENSVE|nr:hypothetical protein B296_00022030 [Ensete ventricosum]RWW03690.1 hypothetical protein GW17_00033130 [Ensete ventricosum]